MEATVTRVGPALTMTGREGQTEEAKENTFSSLAQSHHRLVSATEKSYSYPAAAEDELLDLPRDEKKQPLQRVDENVLGKVATGVVKSEDVIASGLASLDGAEKEAVPTLCAPPAASLEPAPPQVKEEEWKAGEADEEETTSEAEDEPKNEEGGEEVAAVAENLAAVPEELARETRERPEDWNTLVEHLLPVNKAKFGAIRRKVDTTLSKTDEEGQEGKERSHQEEWFDIMMQDISGRLGAVRRSRQRIQRAFKEDLFRSHAMEREDVAAEFTKESVGCVLAAASATMLRGMDSGLEKESEALEGWLQQLDVMRQMQRAAGMTS
ncbi:hypothetical protein HOP50_12g67540 [Chloropicon primus]|uniref:Uncharacterized protein n=1 Tax=Chloropicon primus TaxID=1764295 RepID=A0A5B8MV35_9CHLO|nr:hypothetical protein A3770_12p67350 [Chloropicon primus]UPR03425.1 hypothetical protein HOP50_12g67540 [Chloropicon primus]|eukprot:QDZ24217.1 hypothetical protein A3770_12p67350 [Chloropicon primus]